MTLYLFLGIFFGGGLLLFAIVSAGKGAAGAALVLGIIWLPICAVLGMRSLVLLVANWGPALRATREAVQEGRIAPSYLLRSPDNTSIVAVDEQNKLVMVNGRLVGFGEIREVRYRTGDQNWLEVILSSGENPVMFANLRTEARVTQGYTRLCNTLGFS